MWTSNADVVFGDQLRPPIEILAGLAALSDGVDDTRSLDVEFVAVPSRMSSCLPIEIADPCNQAPTH